MRVESDEAMAMCGSRYLPFTQLYDTKKVVSALARPIRNVVRDQGFVKAPGSVLSDVCLVPTIRALLGK